MIVDLIDTTQEFLFRKLYDPCPLSNKFTNVMERVYKMRINPSLVRIMYSTYLRNRNLSGLEWKKEAEKMGHSLIESVLYSVAKKD